MDKNKLIIFDFDGVLVNTNDITKRLHTEANPHLSEDYFDRMHDGNFWENLEKAVREDGYIVQPDWYELYSKALLDLTTEEMLKMVVIDMFAKYTLVIVSSMENKYIERQLVKENIRHCFSEILGSDIHKSKVVKINDVLSRHNIDPSQAIFITDTAGDMSEGRECGVQSIGVTWGMQTKERLLKEKPYAVADTANELEKAVKSFFSHA